MDIVLTEQGGSYIIDFAGCVGKMAEWLKALVLKTSDVERHRGFESLSLRHFCDKRTKAYGIAAEKTAYGEVPKWPKGLPC